MQNVKRERDLQKCNYVADAPVAKHVRNSAFDRKSPTYGEYCSKQYPENDATAALPEF